MYFTVLNLFMQATEVFTLIDSLIRRVEWGTCTYLGRALGIATTIKVTCAEHT